MHARSYFLSYIATFFKRHAVQLVYIAFYQGGSFNLYVATAIWYATSKGGDYNWLANDILGTCFCIQAIEMMSLGTYQNGVILLSGLFFYDIFWVFGTGETSLKRENKIKTLRLLFLMQVISWRVTTL